MRKGSDMAQREWTAEQRSAIDVRSRDLLVSAGAGSGKTSVMAERIINRICDENDPCDLGEMLIVTFTVAAAGELRERITQGLRSRSVTQRDPRLRRALSQIGSANISTINSFCLSVVRRNFAALGLPATMRVADEAEDGVISEEVMDETIEAFFSDSERYGVSDFAAFCENFIRDRDDKMGGNFLAIYKKLLSIPRGVGLLADKAEALEGVDAENFFDSEWGALIKKDTIETLRANYERLCDALAFFQADEKLMLNYGDAIKDSVAIIKELLDDPEADYETFRLGLGRIEFPQHRRFKFDSMYKTPELDLYKTFRDALKKDVERLRDRVYAMPASEIPMLARLTRQTILDLGAFLSEFERRLKNRKKELGVLTFSDCERYAMELLCSPDGTPTDMALGYREKIKEIYIDEYQDTNELQDLVFRSIARPRSRFMVGDVKQSIYGFRSAEPALFAGYRSAWAQYSSEIPSDHSSIFLSANFRSMPRILNTVNKVFTPLFSVAGNIDYREEDELRIPAIRQGQECDPVRLVIAYRSESKKIPREEREKITRGPRYIAREISNLAANGEKFENCAVLVRKNSMIQKVADALIELGIPYDSASSDEFFKYPEIVFVMSVLQVINNPSRDVHLAAVLTSPLYGISFDDFAEMRISAPHTPLIDYVRASEDERCRRFARDLEAWRTHARCMTSNALIRWLYDNYGLVNAACTGLREERKNIVRINCNRLYDIALGYEGSSYKGLYSFLDYAASLADSSFKQNIPVPQKGGGVKIMTIHNSKGLEFDNCFIYTGNRGYKKTGVKPDIVFSKNLGFGVMVREKDGMFKYDTPFRSAVIRENEIRESEEELRVMYVALTRAKNRLYVVSESSDPSSKESSYSCFRKYFNKNFVYNYDKYLDLILGSLTQSVCGGDYEIIVDDGETEYKINAVTAETAEDVDTSAVENEYLRRMTERFSYVYPYADATAIPAKLSVSRLYPGLLDETDASASLDDPTVPKLAKPSFGSEEQKRGGAFAGTATHVFMQFADFDNLKTNGAKAELERLKAEEFISDELTAAVRLDHIASFVRSKLFADITASPNVWRERRFNVLLPAIDFTEDKEKNALENEHVLVQGVVDCVYESADGGLVLVDYKTDSVYGMDREAAEKMLRERHTLQLTYYKRALEKLTGRRVVKTLVYSFGLGDTVSIDA